MRQASYFPTLLRFSRCKLAACLGKSLLGDYSLARLPHSIIYSIQSKKSWRMSVAEIEEVGFCFIYFWITFERNLQQLAPLREAVKEYGDLIRKLKVKIKIYFWQILKIILIVSFLNQILR